LTGAVEVATGARHTCVRHQSGAVLCFGNNEHGGSLGNMYETDAVACPMPVWNVEDAKSITAGVDTTCAELRSGKMRCWGGDSSAIQEISGDKVDTPYGTMIETRGLDDGAQLEGAQPERTQPERTQPEQTQPKPAELAEAFVLAAARPGELQNTSRGNQAGQPTTAVDDEEDSCPMQRSWGDPSAPNSLTMRMGDRTRTFHLERAVVELDDDTLELRLTPFYVDDADGRNRRSWQHPRLVITLPANGAPDEAAEPLAVHTRGGPREDRWGCMRFIPRVFGTAELTRFVAPDGGAGEGLVEGTFNLYAGSPEFGAISGSFRARDFVPAQTFEQTSGSRNAYRKGDEMVDAAQVEVIYRPEGEYLAVTLREHALAPDAPPRIREHGELFALRDFPGEPGTYEDYDKEFVIETFADGVVRGEVYEMRQIKGPKKPRSSVDQMVTFGSSGSNEQGDEPETPDVPKLFATKHFEANPPEKERVLVARFSTHKATTIPAMGKLEVTLEAPEDAAGQAKYDKTFELGDVQPLELTGAPEPAHVVFERLPGVRDTSESLHVWTVSMREMQGWQLRETGEPEQGLRLARFVDGDEHTVELRLGSILPKRRTWQQSMRYSIKNLKRKYPQLAKFEHDDRKKFDDPIEITAEFADGEVTLTVKNKVQGADSFTMDVPENTFLPHQRLVLLEHLPLSPGYATTFHELKLNHSHMFGFRDYKPEIDEVGVGVIGEDTIEVDGVEEKVWVVRVDKRVHYVSKESGVVRIQGRWNNEFGRVVRATP
jgi:hypothetical protein